MDVDAIFRDFEQYMSVEQDGEDWHDLTDACCGGQSKPTLKIGMSQIHIHATKKSNGGTLPVLKTMVTNVCQRDCAYCAFHSSRDIHRHAMTPDDLAAFFMRVHQAGLVKGLFLSSGIPGSGSNTQNKILDTGEILRRKLGYQGYLHMKIMPGSERGQVERAMQLADRVSINLEAPTEASLARLAPRKDLYNELLQPLRWAEEFRLQSLGGYRDIKKIPSTCTQFVVGVDEHDQELLKSSQYLYKVMNLKRVYYSPFRPIVGTPLENHPRSLPVRTYRLYQASFLLRDYGFQAGELEYEEGFLPTIVDPKLAWARRHLISKPVEITTASRERLLRIPGIGPKSAKWILHHRGSINIHNIGSLIGIGVRLEAARPFILVRGKKMNWQPGLGW